MVETKTNEFLHKGKHHGNSKGKYSQHQDFLYNRVLFGLSVYSKEEVSSMQKHKSKKIKRVHQRAQTILNLWKQEIVNQLSNYFFITIFPGTPITKELTEDLGTMTDELYINRMSLKSLQITKEQVIDKFIKEELLPKNFYQLNSETDADRICSQRGSNPGTESGEHSGGRNVKVLEQTG